MRKRSTAYNEVKTRVDDRTYEGIQIFKQLHGIDSDSAALARMASEFLFGHVGKLPIPLIGRTSEPSQLGTKAAA